MRLFKWTLLISLARVLAACAVAPPTDPSTFSEFGPKQTLGQVVSVAFGPNGRLWRLIPGNEHVFVDYSEDFGKTFQNRMIVNQKAQEIQAQSEDRPALAIGKNGEIFVIYFAKGPVPWATFFSYSTDQGKHFSEPVLVSDMAATAKHYQDIPFAFKNARFEWVDFRGGLGVEAQE